MLASVKLVCWLVEGLRRCCCLLFCWGLFVIFVKGAAVNDGLGMLVFVSLIVVVQPAREARGPEGPAR